jgi:hypothetical protein
VKDEITNLEALERDAISKVREIVNAVSLYPIIPSYCP